MHRSPFPRGGGVRGGVLYGRDDVVVGAAATQIPAHPIADLLRRARVALLDARDACHDLARGAVAALEGVAFDEGRLQGMERTAFGKPLDRGDLAPLDQ